MLSIVEPDMSRIGFIVLGHGLEGKETSMLTDGDLDEMYQQHINNSQAHVPPPVGFHTIYEVLYYD